MNKILKNSRNSIRGFFPVVPSYIALVLLSPLAMCEISKARKIYLPCVIDEAACGTWCWRGCSWSQCGHARIDITLNGDKTVARLVARMLVKSAISWRYFLVCCELVTDRCARLCHRTGCVQAVQEHHVNPLIPTLRKTISQSQKVIEHERFCVGVVRRGQVISQQFVSLRLAFESISKKCRTRITIFLCETVPTRRLFNHRSHVQLIDATRFGLGTVAAGPLTSDSEWWNYDANPADLSGDFSRPFCIICRAIIPKLPQTTLKNLCHPANNIRISSHVIRMNEPFGGHRAKIQCINLTMRLTRFPQGKEQQNKVN